MGAMDLVADSHHEPTAEECEAHISAFCPTFHHAIELIGRRWTGAILRAMLSGEARFSDIASVVPGLSDRLLSERLKELEAEGIVSRTVVASTPVRVNYALTEKGQALNEVILAISSWGEQWLSPAQETNVREKNDP